MEFINTNHQAGDQHWELRDASGQPVEVGRLLTTTRDNQEGLQFEIAGGRPPHKPSSTGKVYGKWVSVAGGDDMLKGSSEYYPQVFNLKWIDLKAERTPEKTAEKPAAPSSPSGQLIGVIIEALVADAVKAAIKGGVSFIINQQIESLRAEFVTKSDLSAALDVIDDEYLKADEHDFVESDDLDDAIEGALDSRVWDIDDHSSEIQDLMQTSLQSEVESIVQDMVRSRALIVSLNPE
tara:strand:- start:1402 stop:2112 length:711 start_codon:yes stop_codon:yes gene_type:complete